MEQGFLEKQSRHANMKNRRLILILLVIDALIMAFLFFALKDSIDLTRYEDKKLVVIACIIAAIMAVSVMGVLLKSCFPAKKGQNLKLPFNEGTKESIGKLIDREIYEGNVLVDEYIYDFSNGKKPYGDKVMLTSSYLLLVHERNNVVAIPRDKIYWICAQVGQKGRSSFIVRFLVFTEKQTFYLDGVDIEHVEEIADKMYQYIPNIFWEYDPFVLSYELENLFNKERESFLQFYEQMRNKFIH